MRLFLTERFYIEDVNWPLKNCQFSLEKPIFGALKATPRAISQTTNFVC